MRTPLTLRRKCLLVATVAVFLVGGGFGPPRAGSDGKDTRSARAKAANAALHETGGGRVAETEFDHNTYDIEVVLLDGRRVEVNLDQDLAVVSSEAEDVNRD